jgi:hypothetical protein
VARRIIGARRTTADREYKPAKLASPPRPEKTAALVQSSRSAEEVGRQPDCGFIQLHEQNNKPESREDRCHD